ncbi:four helix bundle protein [Candidatus Omnitrophota bacterium]
MKEQKFRKLEVWSKAMDLIEEIYKITGSFPQTETYGLTSQLRRAATSISLNIAEGSGSASDNEFKRFLTISLRSAYEVMCGIEVAKRLQYCNEINVDAMLKKCDEISAMLVGLKKKLSTVS